MMHRACWLFALAGAACFAGIGLLSWFGVSGPRQVSLGWILGSVFGSIALAMLGFFFCALPCATEDQERKDAQLVIEQQQAVLDAIQRQREKQRYEEKLAAKAVEQYIQEQERLALIPVKIV